jgi:hypothetical protein
MVYSKNIGSSKQTNVLRPVAGEVYQFRIDKTPAKAGV